MIIAFAIIATSMMAFPATTKAQASNSFTVKAVNSLAMMDDPDDTPPSSDGDLDILQPDYNSFETYRALCPIRCAEANLNRLGRCELLRDELRTKCDFFQGDARLACLEWAERDYAACYRSSFDEQERCVRNCAR